MSAINSDRFEQICDDVWRDRASVLTDRGHLRGEAALVRAVYYRLCKAGGTPNQRIEDYDIEHMLLIYQRLIGGVLTEHAQPHFSGTPLLRKLVRQYLYEAGQSDEV
jgi:hypothetical protein